jgi:hypothetical protein
VEPDVQRQVDLDLGSAVAFELDLQVERVADPLHGRQVRLARSTIALSVKNAQLGNSSRTCTDGNKILASGRATGEVASERPTRQRGRSATPRLDP